MEISKEMLDYLDERYVQKDDCNDRHKAAADEIKEILIVQTRNNTMLNTLVKINSVELGAVATAIIAAIMKLILK